jgi:hypothetical protein
VECRSSVNGECQCANVQFAHTHEFCRSWKRPLLQLHPGGPRSHRGWSNRTPCRGHVSRLICWIRLWS